MDTRAWSRSGRFGGQKDGFKVLIIVNVKNTGCKAKRLDIIPYDVRIQEKLYCNRPWRAMGL